LWIKFLAVVSRHVLLDKTIKEKNGEEEKKERRKDAQEERNKGPRSGRMIKEAKVNLKLSALPWVRKFCG
jgi:hypothetical protein